MDIDDDVQATELSEGWKDQIVEDFSDRKSKMYKRPDLGSNRMSPVHCPDKGLSIVLFDLMSI